MGNFNKSLYPIILLILMLLINTSCQKNEINLHYLGHSAVFLEFNEKVTVLCDYGKENAYLEWGWDSPIYDAGEPGPDIITYSHRHEDHFDERRADIYDAIRITGLIDTCYKKLKIKGLLSSEKDISRYDNHSYLFSIGDVKVLHLGDCQADIMMVNDPAHAWDLEQRYPKDCDILIMPIEGTQKYILQAIKMVELLEPKVLIPTHYWSEEYKQEFIDEIKRIYSKNNKTIFIDNIDGAEFIYNGKYSEEGLLIPNLKPAARE